ncbi:putative Acyltransferase family protein [Magnetospirillum sp. XM-1]|uniref:acyltransferase family protein n=1 Tax=Magnetospirillum sp. XM-1 TaxID=1663591 RepID=UPI00073DF185|nr:acyltransferase family protein [Magnetospirillum sp. XM-1]CUW39911.1 putative Acyltransferase family protein [Magnetospirillum sp. XM-1]
MALVSCVAFVEKPGFSALLDHVRWLSALTVLCGHARNALFLPYGENLAPGPLEWLFYALTNMQNEAVVCFFVISGLLIGGKLLDYAEQPAFPVRRYVIDRLSRLYLVLLPALVLSAIPAAFGFCEVRGSAEWLGAALYLQHVLVPVTACNTPIWSLANEFWYYALGMTAVLSWRGSRLALGALAVMVALLLAADPWTSQNVLLYLPFWLLGMAVSWRRWPGLGPWPTFGLFMAALAVSRSHALDGVFWLRDALIALGLTGFLAAASSASVAVGLAGLGRRLAGFSFTLYLTHWPLLLLIIGWIRRSGHVSYPLNPERWESYVLWLGTVMFCLAFAALLARITEARTGKVRVLLEGRFRA